MSPVVGPEFCRAKQKPPTHARFFLRESTRSSLLAVRSLPPMQSRRWALTASHTSHAPLPRATPLRHPPLLPPPRSRAFTHRVKIITITRLTLSYSAVLSPVSVLAFPHSRFPPGIGNRGPGTESAQWNGTIRSLGDGYSLLCPARPHVVLRYRVCRVGRVRDEWERSGNCIKQLDGNFYRGQEFFDPKLTGPDWFCSVRKCFSFFRIIC